MPANARQASGEISDKEFMWPEAEALASTSTCRRALAQRKLWKPAAHFRVQLFDQPPFFLYNRLCTGFNRPVAAPVLPAPITILPSYRPVRYFWFDLSDFLLQYPFLPLQ
jgi:hypothetical protein